MGVYMGHKYTCVFAQSERSILRILPQVPCHQFFNHVYSKSLTIQKSHDIVSVLWVTADLHQVCTRPEACR